MGSVMTDSADVPRREFGYRPWVRRAGLSILFVAAVVTALIVVFVSVRPSAAFGWAREPFVWVYIGTLWAGGLKVFLGTLRPIATVDEERVVLRPLHQLRDSSIAWRDMLGTEQMTGGDRMIVYYASPRGMRFVALNLNLVKGRREFLQLMDERLRAMQFVERTVDRSRYLSKPA
jgi:hypothetical protein